tara:strand:- start:2622 stop:3125 length:504 start_codon:yes stop_codon:yes gene_type:complete
MKKLLILLFAFTFSNGLIAQEKRASPLVEKTENIDNVEVKIQYGETSMKGREIFGNLVPYGKVWRTGANEATVIEFNKDVKLNEQLVKAGKYSLFTIPDEGKWTIIINSIWDQWGAYNYDENKDILRFEVDSKKVEKHEKLNINLSKEGSFQLIWEETSIEFTVSKA